MRTHATENTRYTEDTFYREHVLQRTHSTENTFYREHILERERDLRVRHALPISYHFADFGVRHLPQKIEMQWSKAMVEMIRNKDMCHK